MVIPKTLAQNSGFDPQDMIVKLQDAFVESKLPVGLDVSTGVCVCVCVCVFCHLTLPLSLQGSR